MAKKKKRAAKKTTGKGSLPEAVIVQHAKRLKKNPRALAIYKRVLGV